MKSNSATRVALMYRPVTCKKVFGHMVAMKRWRRVCQTVVPTHIRPEPYMAYAGVCLEARQTARRQAHNPLQRSHPLIGVFQMSANRSTVRP